MKTKIVALVVAALFFLPSFTAFAQATHEEITDVGRNYQVIVRDDMIYWATADGIFRRPLSGGTIEGIVSEPVYPNSPSSGGRGGNFVIAGKHIYWTRDQFTDRSGFLRCQMLRTSIDTGEEEVIWSMLNGAVYSLAAHGNSVFFNTAFALYSLDIESGEIAWLASLDWNQGAGAAKLQYRNDKVYGIGQCLWSYTERSGTAQCISQCEDADGCASFAISETRSIVIPHNREGTGSPFRWVDGSVREVVNRSRVQAIVSTDSDFYWVENGVLYRAKTLEDVRDPHAVTDLRIRSPKLIFDGSILYYYTRQGTVGKVNL